MFFKFATFAFFSYYHSIYDGAEKLGYSYETGESSSIVRRVSTLAEKLAEFLWKRSSSPSSRVPAFNSNRTLVNELLHCYLDTAACRMFFAASNKDTPPFYR